MVSANMKSIPEALKRVLSYTTLSVYFQFHLSSFAFYKLLFLKNAISKHLLNICSVPNPEIIKIDVHKTVSFALQELTGQ